MSQGRNKGGSARDILSRGSRQTQEAAQAAPPAPAKVSGARRERTKRITVDLPRDEHKFLRDFAYDADADGMRVVRALLAELREDGDLTERILGRLARR